MPGTRYPVHVLLMEKPRCAGAEWGYAAPFSVPAKRIRAGNEFRQDADRRTRIDNVRLLRRQLNIRRLPVFKLRVPETLAVSSSQRRSQIPSQDVCSEVLFHCSLFCDDQVTELENFNRRPVFDRASARTVSPFRARVVAYSSHLTSQVEYPVMCRGYSESVRS